jgi:hypothetical protein
MRGVVRTLLALALTCGVLGLAACGGERTFTAPEFVDEMNDNGAALALGPVLTTNPDGVDIYSISLTEISTGVGSPPKPVPAGAPGSGSMLILDDAEGARAEFARCEQSPELTCFRAANAVLRFQALQGGDQARIVTAIQAIETDPG